MTRLHEFLAKWQDQRSDPSEYDKHLASLGMAGLRADNVEYTSKSRFRFGGKRFHEVQCELSLPKGGKPHIIYYEPYPSMFLSQGFSPIANFSRRTTRIRYGLFKKDLPKANRAVLAERLFSKITEVIPDAATLTQREQELGRPENIIILSVHGGVQEQEREHKSWIVSVERNKLALDHKILGGMEEMVRKVIGHHHGNVDRIIISACNPGKLDIDIDQPHLRINYIHGDIMQGYGRFYDYMVSTRPISYKEFDSDTPLS